MNAFMCMNLHNEGGQLVIKIRVEAIVQFVLAREIKYDCIMIKVFDWFVKKIVIPHLQITNVVSSIVCLFSRDC